MSKRVSIAVCLVLGAAGFGVGSGCTSIPDHRKTLPEDFVADASAGGGASDDGGGAGGRTGSGGKIGASGGAGTGVIDGGDAAAGGADAGPDGGERGTITCEGTNGSVTCKTQSSGTTKFEACCAGLNLDQCGLQTKPVGIDTCLALAQEGHVTTDCPSHQKGSVTLEGCCRADATCGLEYRIGSSGPNFGCIEPTTLGFAAGADCTPVVCKPSGEDCLSTDDCCDVRPNGAACVTFSGDTSQCTSYCTTNAECASGCCVLLTSGRGACGLTAAECGTTCQSEGSSCDTDADCCTGTICAPGSDAGPRICSKPCTGASQCTPTTGVDRAYCVYDPGKKRSACSPQGAGLCTNTCLFAKDGVCEDGGPKSDPDDTSCALGTDCDDCAKATASNGVRLGGFENCDDSCPQSPNSANNGKCEDNGPGSTDTICDFGTDCSDCGPRLGICSNYCKYANDGECDDGGKDAVDALCAFGTDCSDCGYRFGGRGQAPCDASGGTLCTPRGSTWYEGVVADDTCSCPDCEWDSGPRDCDVADLCDGTSISACCAADNPCDWGGDEYCDCNGWCSWDQSDCFPSTTSSAPSSAPRLSRAPSAAPRAFRPSVNAKTKAKARAR